MVGHDTRRTALGFLAYALLLLFVSNELSREPMPTVGVLPMVVAVVALALPLSRAALRYRLMGRVPPRRRATIMSALVLLVGAFSFDLLVPDGAGWDWLWVQRNTSSWIVPSFFVFVVASLIPDALNREGWVTASGLIFAVLGALTLFELRIVTYPDTEIVSKGAAVGVFLLCVTLFVGVLSYLRFDVALQR